MGRRERHGNNVRNILNIFSILKGNNSALSSQTPGAKSPTLCHRFWGKDQPNSYDGRNQDCVEFWYHSTNNGNWNDENCNVDQNWICEM